MKKILLVCALLVQCLASHAEDWLTSVPAAIEKVKATNSGKKVLLDFTGSDWCIWCKRLDTNLLSTPAFADFAREKLVLVKLDFPHYTQQDPEVKKANIELARKYNVSEFPTLMLLSADGDLLWRHVGVVSLEDLQRAANK